MTCPNCNSQFVIKKGIDRAADGTTKQRMRCKECNHNYYIMDVFNAPLPVQTSLIETDNVEGQNSDYTRSPDWLATRLNSDKYVISSVQSNTQINRKFLGALLQYCEQNEATLLLIPTRYHNPSRDGDTKEHYYHESVKEYLMENNVKVHPMLKVLGKLKIMPTAENPLAGLAPISKGDSVIVGHNQVQQTTLPVQADDHPVIMTTTGTISKQNYSVTKQGYKAEFNHSLAAVVVEIGREAEFHIRHLNFDGTGFYDFNWYYDEAGCQFIDSPIDAIVTGDEHAIFIDEGVAEATYGDFGIVRRLKPKYIVRHDVLDCYAVSHHHRSDGFTKFKKHITGQNSMKEELDTTVNHIIDTTPDFATNLLVPSNHTDHLTRWLNECDVKHEPWNAIMYHYLSFKMLNSIESNPSGSHDPFKMFSEEIFAKNDCDTIFLSRSDTFKIHDIEIAAHGDKGVNGARGTRTQFARLPAKSIVGHSHSPGIEKGCYQVGTSSTMKLEYNVGPSSWMNTHCLIYKNGKRQLINIINGEWRA